MRALGDHEPRKNRIQFGFTLVELIITLILIGAISALGIALLASPSAYSAGAARDQFISSALLAQKRALANTDATVALTITESAGQWCFRVSAKGDAGCSGNQRGARTAAREGASLQNNPGTLYYRGIRRVNASDEPISAGSNIDLNFVPSGGGAGHPACISASGFAYPERCIDG
ncbi:MULTISPECIES: pilus assembly FimT family protein [Halomonadaceae]|uniref:Prepilin-type N-terminal cleavage/methylation domain-containing protein n=1 Tax=Vreelandella halophila TaxID=86177 RepID=A0A9X4YEG9_9GAMM|nr:MULTISPECIES: type II secretion system protein [Halomonas]MYL27630.1 prepilin-type N-terminal cleavage/methylation domain-containing protein [Halomonas utahensis]MYL75967.1 prepilin-type N-terminal cleavage/methylation domain-containing protein [Halomonas sp. 22501_18_FS]